MNTFVIACLTMVILSTGLILGPLFAERLGIYEAQAQKATTIIPTTKIKQVTLIAE